MSGNLHYLAMYGERGDRHIYHRGFLFTDRTEHPTVEKVASQAMQLQEEGRVVLLQRKHRAFHYDYIAVRT